MENIRSPLPNNMNYIITFYSHFGAVHFKKICQLKGLEAKMMPVPRDLSSSCGTCVRYVSDIPCPTDTYPEEAEQIVRITASGYEIVYKAADS